MLTRRNIRGIVYDLVNNEYRFLLIIFKEVVEKLKQIN